MTKSSNFLFSKIYIYLLLLLPFLFFIYIIQKDFYASSQAFRILVEEDDDELKEICSRHEDLYKHYYEDKPYTPKETNFGSMGDGSHIILSFLEKKNSGSFILKYLWYTKAYTAFLVILLLIIVFTIYYNITSLISFCSGKCGGNMFKCLCCKNKFLKIIACILAPLVYIVVLCLASASAKFSLDSLNRFAGTVCVGFQFVNSLINGETGLKAQKWGGIDVISDILTNLAKLTKENNQGIMEIIFNNKNNYDEQTQNWLNQIELSKINHINKTILIESPKIENKTKENLNIVPYYAYKWNDSINDIYNTWRLEQGDIIYIFNIVEKNFFKFFGCEIVSGKIICQPNNTISQTFEKGADLITSIKTPIKNFRNILVKPIQSIYDGINKVLYYFFVVIIAFVILYCSIMVLILGIFFCAKKCRNERGIKDCIRWNLCHIYFMSLFIIIIGFGVGIGIGVIGNLVKDMTNVIEYITGTENLKSENPSVIGNSKVNKYLDVCLNRDGDLARELNLTNIFGMINNLLNITGDSDTIINKTNITYSPIINDTINYIEDSVKNYLNILYIINETNELYNITEYLIEINNYVSGIYSQKEMTCDLLNETWDTIKEKDGYIYDSNYPPASVYINYLIYLYDEDVYNKSNILNNRYINACPTQGRPYETVNEASKDYAKLFYDIKNQITSDKFNKEYIDDLDKLNEIVKIKNQFLRISVIEIKKLLEKINGFLKNYITNKDGIFSLLNCKFVGDNKLILMSILYTSLGVYLDKYGTLTSLWSFFAFVALIFIIIVVRTHESEYGNIDNVEQRVQIELQMKSANNQELIIN